MHIIILVTVILLIRRYLFSAVIKDRFLIRKLIFLKYCHSQAYIQDNVSKRKPCYSAVRTYILNFHWQGGYVFGGDVS